MCYFHLYSQMHIKFLKIKLMALIFAEHLHSDLLGTDCIQIIL